MISTTAFGESARLLQQMWGEQEEHFSTIEE
jgi:hypothetical protein